MINLCNIEGHIFRVIPFNAFNGLGPPETIMCTRCEESWTVGTSTGVIDAPH